MKTFNTILTCTYLITQFAFFAFVIMSIVNNI